MRPWVRVDLVRLEGKAMSRDEVWICRNQTAIDSTKGGLTLADVGSLQAIVYQRPT